SSSVDSLYPFANAPPFVFHVGPIIEADERVLDGRVHGPEGVFLGEDFASNIPLVTDQLLPHVPERPSSRPRFVRLRRLVQRFDEDGGVAHLGQGPRDVTKSNVLSSVRLSAEGRPNQSDEGAEFLQALADLVDHRVTRAAR